MRSRLLTVGLALLAVVLVSQSARPSDAAWVDAVHSVVEVRAGSWDVGGIQVGCHPADPDLPATCLLTGLVWNYWGSGYRLQFGLFSDHPERFEWEVTFDLSAVYEGPNAPPLSGGAPMFPGDPTPNGWSITGFQGSENICLVSAELPVFTVRGVQTGFDWNRTIGGNRQTLASSQGFQIARGATRFPPSCN